MFFVNLENNYQLLFLQKLSPYVFWNLLELQLDQCRIFCYKLSAILFLIAFTWDEFWVIHSDLSSNLTSFNLCLIRCWMNPLSFKCFMFHSQWVTVSLLCPTLCDPMGYTARGILQARILEWVAVPFSRGSSQHRGQTQASRVAGRFFTNWATREAQWLTYIEQVWKGSGKHLVSLSWIPSLTSAVTMLISQLCPTLCNPMNQPDSSVHRILQARILEWVAIPFSRGSSRPKD